MTTWVSASISVSFNRGENGKEALTSSRVAGPSEEVPGSGPPITRSSSVGTSTGKSTPNGVAASTAPGQQSLRRLLHLLLQDGLNRGSVRV